MSLFFGIISILFRFISYTYLRWIPGRQATYTVPILFLITNYPLIKQVFITENNQIITKKIKTVKNISIIPFESSNLTDSDNERIGRRGQSDTVRRKKGSGNSTPTKIVNHNPIESTESIEVIEELKLELPKPTTITAFHTLKSLIIGIKSTSSTVNLITLFINLLILTSVLDSIFTPILFLEEKDLSFTRVSGITHDKVKIFARIPSKDIIELIQNDNNEDDVNSSKVSKDGLLELEKDEFKGAKVEYRPTMPIGKWIKGGNLVVDEKKDWTGVLELENLWASTEYEYRLLLPSLSHSHHPSFHLQKFTTFPDPSLSSPHTSPGTGTHYTFASSSCIKPNFPYTGPFSHNSIPGLKYLLEEIQKRSESGLGGGALKFLLFLGDFIYADTPFFPNSGGEEERKQYFKRYRQVFASEDMKKVVEKLPLISIYDDHEIYNDFSSNETDPHFAPANEAFVSYLGAVNPSSSSSSTSSSSESENYFDFQHGDSAFFIFDTRKYRSSNTLLDTVENEKTMLGSKQKEIFKTWCQNVNETVTWKFIVSSTPMMTLWSHGDDTWSGFQREREELLDVMEFMGNVIVLSGDRHEFAAASLRNGKITEFSTSPLSQFYLPIRTLSQSHGRGKTGEDILLKYLPDGNSKFTTFEVDTRIQNKPIVKVKVIIDGEEVWTVDVLGKALEVPKSEKSLGALGLSLMQLLGFKKRSWF